MTKILFVGDSPSLYTGFGKVLKEIALHVSENTNWKIKCIGWFDSEKEKNALLPFEVVSTNPRDPMDIYGQKTFEFMASTYKPDIVFAIGDEWMVSHLTRSQYRKNYKLILYCPIDGAPIPKSWPETFKKADVFVAYGEFGKKVIQQRDKSFPISVIPHGVHTDVFNKREVVKNKIFDNANFVIGVVGRNQPRKNLPAFIKMLSLFHAGWIKCYNCGSMFHVEKNETHCIRCKSNKIQFYQEKNDVLSYMHCSVEDCGWDLIELLERHNLKKKVVFPKDNMVGQGFSDKLLSDIYNMFDVFTLPTTSEGFCIPLLEAMACGVPCMITNYSAHLDFCSDVSELIDVGHYITEPKTNIERAYVDIDDYVMKMDRMYYDKDTFIIKWGNVLRHKYGVKDFANFIDGKDIRSNMSKVCLERAQKYDWKLILPIWLELFKKLNDKPDEVEEMKIEKI